MNIAVDDDLCTDDGVDVRGSVKGHRHGREALKGMLPYNIVTLPCVCVPNDSVNSIRQRGTGVQPTKAPSGSFFNWGDPAELVQM